MVGDEAGFAGGNRAFYAVSRNRIDTVEDDEFQAGVCSGFHGQSHCGNVGVEAAADVLDVENKGVQVLQLFGGGLAVFSVQAKDGEFCFGVDVVGHWMVECSSEAVFGTEKGCQFDAGRLVKKVNGGLAVFVAAGVVGDQADG